MVKEAALVVAEPLTRIVNESMSQTTLPSEWKYAKVTPLYKREMSTDMDNYCPIQFGFTNCVQHVGWVVHHQLHSFLRKHKLLSNFQCDFRRNHSTEFAAIAFSDYIRRGMPGPWIAHWGSIY